MNIDLDYLPYLVKTYSFVSSLSKAGQDEVAVQGEEKNSSDGEAQKKSSMPHLLVEPAQIFNVIQTLKEKEGLHYLHSISGVHLAEPVGADLSIGTEAQVWEHLGFEVIYHLSNLHGATDVNAKEKKSSFDKSALRAVAVKVILSSPSDELPSIDSLYVSANWFEREIYDLLGIVFIGSRDLTRILLPVDWQGHPLRKDYQEEKTYNGMSTTRESELLQKRVVGAE